MLGQLKEEVRRCIDYLPTARAAISGREHKPDTAGSCYRGGDITAVSQKYSVGLMAPMN
jgi:hypothetical protein